MLGSNCCTRYARLSASFVPFLYSAQKPERVPVARAHSVIYKDVEGRVDEGECFYGPEADQVEVVFATSNFDLRQKEPGKAEKGKWGNTHDEQH